MAGLDDVLVEIWSHEARVDGERKAHVYLVFDREVIWLLSFHEVCHIHELQNLESLIILAFVQNDKNMLIFLRHLFHNIFTNFFIIYYIARSHVSIFAIIQSF